MKDSSKVERIVFEAYYSLYTENITDIQRVIAASKLVGMLLANTDMSQNLFLELLNSSAKTIAILIDQPLSELATSYGLFYVEKIHSCKSENDRILDEDKI